MGWHCPLPLGLMGLCAAPRPLPPTVGLPQWALSLPPGLGSTPASSEHLMLFQRGAQASTFILISKALWFQAALSTRQLWHARDPHVSLDEVLAQCSEHIAASAASIRQLFVEFRRGDQSTVDLRVLVERLERDVLWVIYADLNVELTVLAIWWQQINIQHTPGFGIRDCESL